MAEIDPVILKLMVDRGKYLADINETTSRVNDQLNRQGAAIERLDARMKGGFTRIAGHAQRGAAAIKAAVASVSLIALGAQAVETAIRFKRFEQGLAVATGSASAAAGEIKFLREMADGLGVRFITLAENFTGLAAAARGTSLEGKQTRDVFEAITKAIVATGGSTEQVNGALLAVQQMMSKGNVQAEELRGQLGERLPGAFQIAARAMNVTTAELNKMLEKGEVAASDFLPKFAAQLGKELPANLQTADAAFQRFQTALDDIANSTADGFMKELGDATDDLTQTLKDMQQSGALEAIGSFLGTVIRLGGQAASVIGDLALAWKKWRLEVGVRQQQSIEDGWATSAAQKEQARNNRLALQAELNRMSGAAGPSFAQGSIDSLGKVIAGQRSGSGGAAAGGKPGPKKKGPKGPSAEDITARFNDAMARLMSERLQAELSVTEDYTRRAELQRALLDIEYKQRLADINDQKNLSEERKAAMRTELNALFGLDKDGGILTVPSVYSQVDRDEMEGLAREALDRATAARNNDRDLLEAQSRMVDSRAARRDLELRILDIAYEQERADLEALIASQTATKAQKDIAQARLNILGQLQAADAEGVNRQNESPLEARRREVRETAANMGDAIENIELDAIDRLTDGIAGAASEYVKLGGIAGDVINGIISDLIKLAARQAIVGALTGGTGSILGIKLPGFANGTNSAPGGLALVGERGPEIVNLPRGSQVIPNHELAGAAARSMVNASAASPMARPQEITVYVREGAMFEAAVEGISQRSAVRVVRQAAPEIGAQAAKSAVQATPAYLARQRRFGGG